MPGEALGSGAAWVDGSRGRGEPRRGDAPSSCDPRGRLGARRRGSDDDGFVGDLTK